MHCKYTNIKGNIFEKKLFLKYFQNINFSGRDLSIQSLKWFNNLEIITEKETSN